MFFFFKFSSTSGFGYEKNNNFAFITNQLDDSLDIINLDELRVIRNIKVGKKPAGIVINKDKKKIYISNPGGNSISIIDLIKNEKNEVFAGNNPLGIELSLDQKKIFISNWFDNLVTVINLENYKIVKQIKTKKSPAGLEIIPFSGDLLVANKGDNSISIIDTKNFTIKKSINVGKTPFGIFSDSVGKYAYVTNVQSNSISVIDLTKLTLIKDIVVGKWPYQVAIDELHQKLYVSNQRGNSISIIDLVSYSEIKKLENVCEYPEGINIDFNNRILVIACWFDDEVVILDLLNYSLKSKISVSGGPRSFGEFILNK